MKSEWQVPINQLLYGLIFTREITDEVVTAAADAAVNYTALSLGPEVYYRAIREALTSGEDPDRLNQLPQFDHAQVGAFLRAVAARLYELRPWPEPKFRRLDVAAWTKFGQAVTIAQLNASILRVGTLLRQSFDSVGDSQPDRYVLMLRLQTGETVALLGSYGRDEKVTILSDATSNPVEVIEHFIAATGFPAKKVTTI